MEALGSAATVFSVIELGAKICSVCFKYSKAVKNSATEITQLQEAVEVLKNVAEQVQDLLKKPEGQELKKSKSLDQVLKQSYAQLQEIDQKLQSKPTKTWKTFARALKWPFQREEVDGLIRDLQGYNETISHILQVYQTNLLHELCLKAILGTLATANGASFDSHDERHNAVCLPGTRVELLDDIKTWANDSSSKSLFWLNGMAGTGKSTISRTICHDFTKCGQLGASFFFKRGEGDRGNLSRFVTTLATQLSEKYPDFAQSIRKEVDADKAIVRKGPRDQFEKLIKEPLASISLDSHETPFLVFVIDALDECDNDDDIKLIINLFSSCASLTNPNIKLKWLITSRPDLPIRLGFSAVKGTFQDLVLHEIPPSFVERDISTFLKHELDSIKTEYNGFVSSDKQLSLDWPKAQSVEALATKAIPLFIFAATICRFINDRGLGDPDDLLEQILGFEADGQSSQLDATYLPVLNNLIKGRTGKSKTVVIEMFQAIVGPIVVLASPLTTAALGDLLDLPKKKIDGQLELLHSVLDVPTANDLPVRLFHLSFRDFLVDPEKQGENPFWVDEKETHRSLAQNCLRVMKKHLRQDICQLVLPATKCAEIENEVVQNKIPLSLQYACLYWVSHLQKGEVLVDDSSDVLQFLRENFLHWLEVMSLIGRAPESLEMLRTLQAILKPEESRDLQAFLQDAARMIRTNLPTITGAPLQIYSSVLAFSPRNSLVRRVFEHKIPKWISVKPGTINEWDQCEQVLEGHTRFVNSVAFSPDGRLVASASHDQTVRLWQSDNGTCVQELKGHTKPVFSVAFSPDGQLVATGSQDKTVCLWRSDDGTCVQELKGHTGWVNSVAFSPDGQLVASASNDETVRLWRTDDGSCVQELKGHTSWVNAVAFSPNGRFVASGSKDKTTRIWSVDDSTCVQELEGHAECVRSVAFSPDGQLVASSSDDKTVRLWRSDDGTLLQELKGHTESVRSVAFSPDGQFVTSASWDETVRLWQSDDGTCIQEFKGHTKFVNSVAFSFDGRLVASASHDETVWLWRLDPGTCAEELEGHTRAVFSVAFSPDGKLVASASNDQTVRLWRSDDGACIQELKGHTNWVSSMAFSPDGQLLASASNDQTVRLWRTDDGSCVQELKGHSNWVNTVTFSPDGQLLASASHDQTVRLWRSDDGSCIHELEGHSDGVFSVAFSTDGQLVASGSKDKTARLWRIDDGSCVQELKGHTGCVRPVIFSPDGRLIASASRDGTVRLWQSDDGACLQELNGHTKSVRSVAFSPDSQVVASASRDRTIRLWESNDGTCVQELKKNTETLKFDSLGTVLIADRGVMATPDGSSINPTASPSLAENFSGANISSDGCWILWKTIPILWLPLSFRPDCSSVDGSTVVIGSRSGRVTIMRFENLEFLTGAM